MPLNAARTAVIRGIPLPNSAGDWGITCRFEHPLQDYLFLFDKVIHLGRLERSQLYGDVDREFVADMLHLAGRLAEEKIAPLQRMGDMEPARLEGGRVTTTTGFAEGFRAIAEGGWIGTCASPSRGGMGLPTHTTEYGQRVLQCVMCFSRAECPVVTGPDRGPGSSRQ